MERVVLDRGQVPRCYLCLGPVVEPLVDPKNPTRPYVRPPGQPPICAECAR